MLISLAHLLHSYTKQAGDEVQTDIESLVVKMLNHFSSAKCTEELKAIFDFLGEDYENLLPYVGTKWLTLYTAVKRLTKCWPTVRSYFLSLGREDW